VPDFRDAISTPAPPEEVWKLLYDASRFPDWWEGIETVQDGDAKGGAGDLTFYPDGYPDFPMPQQLESSSDDGRVKISCLVSDLRFEWRLEQDGGGTRISVDVEIPEEEAARLQTQQDVIAASLRNLAELAASA
jgi:uncharacterized protein YndB with AHSA1/START domain